MRSVLVSGSNPHLLRAELRQREKRGHLTQITGVREISPGEWGSLVVMHKMPWSTRRRAIVTAAIALPALAGFAWVLIWVLQGLLALLPLILGGAAVFVMILALLSRPACYIEVIHHRRH